MQLINFSNIEKWVFSLYFVITTIIFLYFFKTAPPLIHDQLLYFNLSDKLLNNHLNLFITSFENRGFAYPLLLSLVKIIIPMFIIGKSLFIFYLVNLTLFHISNIFLFKLIKIISIRAGLFFLIVSSFNIINLSFTTTILSESLSLFIISAVVYLLLRNPKRYFQFLSLGFLSALLIFTRLNAIVCLIAVSFYIGLRELRWKRYLNLSAFFIGVALVLLTSLLNVYFTTSNLSLFSPETLKSSDTKYPNGIIYFKMEASVDTRFESPEMLYINTENFKINRECSGLINCQIHYLKQEPLAYLGMILTHLFILFDRTYIKLYIEDVFAVNNLLRFCNYFVLSGVLIYLSFFKKNNKQTIFANTSVSIISINMLPYLPTVVEARYSAPLYAIFLSLFSLYIVDLFKLKKNEMFKSILTQVIIIFLFFLISNEIAQTLYIG